MVRSVFTKMFASSAKSTNSRQQFVATLNASFDTAESLLQKNYNAAKTFKQTKLPYGNSVKRPKIEDVHNSAAPQQYAKPEFLLLPLPLPKESFPMKRTVNLNKTVDVVTQASHADSVGNFSKKLPAAAPNIDPILLKDGRRKIALIGQIDFCLKMHKVHPNMDALWDVYGQLKRLTKGKQRGENILLLRNLDRGPILQSIYYDFNLRSFESGCFLRAIGRFVGENRLHTFKIQKIEEEKYMHCIQHFTRIQNVASFALLQNEE